MTLATSQVSAPRPKSSRRPELLEGLVGHDPVEEGVERQGGRDGVHPDPGLGPLGGGSPGEGHHPGLGRRVVGLFLLGPPAEDRGVVDDHPGPPGEHVAHGGADAAEGSRQGDVEDRRPLLVGHLHDLRRAAEAGVVDGHVDPAVLGDRRVVETEDIGLVGDVAGNSQGPGPGDLPQPVGGLLEAPGMGVGDDDGRSLLGAALGGGETDPRPRRRRDDDDLPREQSVGRRWVDQVHAGTLGSGGRPRTRSPMMLCWISLEPP